MIISEEECLKWAEPGGWGRQKWSVDTVEYHLDRSGLRAEHPFDFYVQGSFANNTHTGPESDIDVVVALQECWMSNARSLPRNDRQRYTESTVPATYGWREFRQSIDEIFGPSFFRHWGDRCLRLSEHNSPILLPIDILVCVEYRHYLHFHDNADQEYIAGVCFIDQYGNWIVNFPKRHLERGEEKDAAVHGNYKPVVRIMKNAYREAVLRELLPKGTAAGYFIECLLWNVSNECYSPEHCQSFYRCLEWLLKHKDDLPAFHCQHGTSKLFGTGPEHWTVEKALALINCLSDKDTGVSSPE